MRPTFVAAAALFAAVPGWASPTDPAEASRLWARADASSSATVYCCNALKAALGDFKVSYEGANSYNSSLQTYWALQQVELNPYCIVSPETPQDVSKAIATLTQATWYSEKFGECQFAVRGAGHTPWAGSSNVQDGITIDLGAMKNVTVSPDRSMVSIGGGARWMDVYMTLDAQNLSTSGGRVADVGVGGLTLGGGMSFFAPRYGFVCDNVLNYEIVTSNGTLINANATSYPDLFWALKGGSNNFGVVTRFDMKAFEQGKFWGGFIVYPGQLAPQLIEAFVAFNNASDYDPYAALINSYAYEASLGVWVVANNVEYTKPEAYPATFKPFTDIKPQLENTMRISNLTDFTLELEASNAYGRRQLFATSTYGNDVTLLNELFQLANSTVLDIKNATDLVFSMTFQAIPSVITSKSAQTGGNALGMDGSKNRVLTLITISWVNADDDARINAAAKNFFGKADAAAVPKGLKEDWIYLNYAAQWQDPIGSYGPENVAKLQNISKVYDPSGVFQTQVTGGYKLFNSQGTVSGNYSTTANNTLLPGGGGAVGGNVSTYDSST